MVLITLSVAAKTTATYNIAQLGFSGYRCIPVIYNTANAQWSYVTAAIQNDLLVVGNQYTQNDTIGIKLFGWDD